MYIVKRHVLKYTNEGMAQANCLEPGPFWGSNADVNNDNNSTWSFLKGLRISVDIQPKQSRFIRGKILRIDKCFKTFRRLGKNKHARWAFSVSLCSIVKFMCLLLTSYLSPFASIRPEFVARMNIASIRFTQESYLNLAQVHCCPQCGHTCCRSYMRR